MSERAAVFNIQKFCLHDGPGLRTAIFFKGCPLSCKWCANPESQRVAPQLLWNETNCLHCGACLSACKVGAISWDDATKSPRIARELCCGNGDCADLCSIRGGGALTLTGRLITLSEAVDELLRDKVFFDNSGGGVTFSGGEVLSQLDFAETLAAELSAKKVHIAAETCGYASHENFARLLAICDLILFDCKHYDSEKHRLGTGVPNELILENLAAAVKSGCAVTARIPVIPGYNDSAEDAKAFGALLSSLGVTCAHILPFHQFGSAKYSQLGLSYEFSDSPALQPSDMGYYEKILKEFLPLVQIGG